MHLADIRWKTFLTRYESGVPLRFPDNHSRGFMLLHDPILPSLRVETKETLFAPVKVDTGLLRFIPIALTKRATES